MYRCGISRSSRYSKAINKKDAKQFYLLLLVVEVGTTLVQRAARGCRMVPPSVILARMSSAATNKVLVMHYRPFVGLGL